MQVACTNSYGKLGIIKITHPLVDGRQLANSISKLSLCIIHTGMNKIYLVAFEKKTKKTRSLPRRVLNPCAADVFREDKWICNIKVLLLPLCFSQGLLTPGTTYTSTAGPSAREAQHGGEIQPDVCHREDTSHRELHLPTFPPPPPPSVGAHQPQHDSNGTQVTVAPRPNQRDGLCSSPKTPQPS